MEQLDLSDFFKTKGQALDFSMRLAIISQKIFETNFDLRKELMEQFGIKKTDKFFSLLRDNKINESSPESVKEFCNIIQLKMSALSVMTLKLALEPREQALQALSQWFVVNINKQVIFDISVDPTLIGGAAIYFNGKYLDFSVKTKFDQILNEMLTKPIETPVTDKEKPVAPENESNTNHIIEKIESSPQNSTQSL